MKIYDHTTRGVLFAGNALQSQKIPVYVGESLLKAPHATFVDRIVFADVEVQEGKICLTAQKSESDERALIFYSGSESKNIDTNDQVSYNMALQSAEMLYLNRTDEYGFYGCYWDRQYMVLAMEPGGYARISVKRITETTVGFWAGLFGARPATVVLTCDIEIGYDGNEVTIERGPQNRVVTAHPEVRQPTESPLGLIGWRWG